jgi:hypothetical protein
MPITSVSRPTYHTAGLLTEKPEILAISGELASAGVDVAAVEILCGERGAAILDDHGRHHGPRGRIVRALQRPGTQLAALAAGAPRTCAVPVRRVTPRDSRSFMAQPALLLTCTTTGTRPTSAASGPGGGR